MSDQPVPEVEVDFADKPARLLKRAVPPVNAVCCYCGSYEVSSLPTFSVGGGMALRPHANDVICRRCGRIGQPEIVGEKRIL